MSIYYVAPTGCDRAAGTLEAPFRTISKAAAIALPGDTVRVREGVYREWVKPAMGGMSNAQRITYEAMPGEHPVIKGSEIIKGWTLLTGTVWQVTLDNALFGDWNPFAQAIEGDWLMSPRENPVHTGEVYLNGKSMYEAYSVEEVCAAARRTYGHQNPTVKTPMPILEPEQTIYQWYAEVGEKTTALFVNFQGADPNEETVEINVRKCCFYPDQPGLNYITLRGFEICQAACPFTPPTADQPGMVGPHWAKGWIIENNHLHDAKCSAISLGKEASTGHNLYSRFDHKPGYQYQMEAVFLGLQAGWCREKIGSHIVRNNVIHDCGQNGVVGHMGASFSTVSHNHIYNIGIKREFFGYEIGGVKFHAAIDAVVEGNCFHHNETGLWMDWQAQGVRITRNVFFDNDRDLMIEVTHGPCTVDNNIFGSAHMIDDAAQGTAYVHNLICGYTYRWAVLNRATPYHYPHTTAVMGCAVVYSGDDRMYNNIYTGENPARNETGQEFVGNQGYDMFTTPEEYPERKRAAGNIDEQKYFDVPQPVWVEGNVYAGHAKPFRAEKDCLMTEGVATRFTLEEEGCFLELTLPEDAAAFACAPVTTQRLGMPRLTEEAFENPDGTPIDFTVALDGVREGTVIPGPFAKLSAGTNRILVWKA